MSNNGPDVISILKEDDVAAIKEHLDAIPDIDFKYNNQAGGPSLTIAWIAAFLGARKCLAEVVRRGANVEFFANETTVRRLGILKRETLLGLVEGGMSLNQEETIVLFLSDFENEMPKSGTVEALDAIIREIGDLNVGSSKNDIARIRKSRAFHEAIPDLHETIETLQRMRGPEAKKLRADFEEQLFGLATTLSEIIFRSLALVSTNSGIFEEVVKRQFRGYRKSRAWLSEAGKRARTELQTRLAPAMDLYEDDEDLTTWIDLALARYPIREAVLGGDGAVIPKRSNGLDFEKRAAAVLEAAGFMVEPTPTTGDQGADIIATRNGLRFAIQCKDYARQVGNAAVQEILAAKAFYQADYAVVCSPGGYTKSAKALAATSSVLLLSPDLLPELDKMRMLVE